jgi:hypothetical protein
VRTVPSFKEPYRWCKKAFTNNLQHESSLAIDLRKEKKHKENNVVTVVVKTEITALNQ